MHSQPSREEAFRGRAQSPVNKLASRVDSIECLRDQFLVLGEVFMLQFTATKTSNYTAAVNDLVRTDSTSGSFTVTMPASPAQNDQVGVLLKTTNSGTGSNTVTVAANAGQTIFNVGASLQLFVAGDYVEFQFDTTDGWVLVVDDRQAHVALLKASTTSAQEFADGLAEQINFVTIDFDNAGMGSTSSNDITIRRSGRYQVNARLSLSGVTKAMTFTGTIRKNGGNASGVVFATIENGTFRYFVPDIFDLSTGDVLTLWLTQASGTGYPFSTTTAASGCPRLSVSEIR
jgi:hypothetical protein